MKRTNGTSDTQDTTYTYNADGDRTGLSDSVTSASATYDYDQADRLTSYSMGGTSASYAYDGGGLRMSKTVAGRSEAFVWDEVEGLPVLLQDGSMAYVTGLNGLPLEQVDGSGNKLYYYQDQLGSADTDRSERNGAGDVRLRSLWGGPEPHRVHRHAVAIRRPVHR